MKKRAFCCFFFFLYAMAGFGQTKPEGSVITAQGTVEYRTAAVNAWSAVAPMQKLFVQDRVHTAAASKAAVLFRDETQIRLNANSELVVHSLSEKKGTSTALELVQGEGWFRTKNPSSDLHVETPGATAAIRGTEINLRVAPDGESVLTVVEGRVVFANTWGSITVNAGEEASARQGQAPTKRLLLNPEDAVQWVIYYPTGIAWHDVLAFPLTDAVRAAFGLLQADRDDEALAALLPLAPGDTWARVGASIAYARRGDYENARAVLGAPVTGALEVERLAQLATVQVETGDSAGALASLDAAKAIDPTALRPAALAVTLALAQNRKDAARETAAAALKAHADSVAAHVSAGESAQADFDLPAALRHFNDALNIDATDIRALVDRARVLFGMGKAAEASADAAAAARRAPNDPQVRSLQGFILLSLGKNAEAAASFAAAVAADASFGEPYLGMGLLAFKKGAASDGLWDMLIATLLDPKISLFQSYLGKSYFQLGRLTEGIAALDSAARLDPKDPTPHLYKSHFLRDLNRHVEALDELNTAIALNDNRAVYRSRLLLDQDLATKNVSLAQVYQKIGVEAWGVSEALTSLGSDFTNAGAHLFLAGLYGDLPDRLQAQQSEYLQYIIFAPVNQNSYSGFGEYTSLLEQPMFSVSTYAEGATPSYLGVTPPSFYAVGEVSTQSGNNLFTHLAMVHYKYQAGARPGVPDQFGFADAQAKVALGLNGDLFFHVTWNLADYGADESTIMLYGTGANAVNISMISTTLDPSQQNTQNLLTATVGGHWDWARGFPLMAMMQYQYNAAENVDPAQPSTVSGVLLNSDFILTNSLFDFQAQQVLHFTDPWQVLVGMDAFSGSWDYTNPIKAYDETTGATVIVNGQPMVWTNRNSTQDTGLHGWVWNELQLGDTIHLSAALFLQVDSGANLFTKTTYDYTTLAPAIGATFDLGGDAVLRCAAYQFRTARFFAESIYPSAIAGFLLDRNEDVYTLRTEAHVSLDTSRGETFLSNHLFYRHSEYPPDALSLLDTADTLGFTTDFDWVIARFLTAAVNNQAELTSTYQFIETSDQLKTSLKLTTPFGLTARLTNAVLGQAFLSTTIPQLENSLFDLLDAEVRLDFPGKHGYASVVVTNVLDQSFTMFTEGLAVTSLYPYRRVTVSLDAAL